MKKKAPINRIIKEKEKAAELKQDITNFFGERDKTNRGGEGLVEDMKEATETQNKISDIIYLDSLKEIPIKSEVIPMFNVIFVTAKRNKRVTEGGILLVTNEVEDLELEYEEIQKVMAVGPQVQQVSVGDEVCISFGNFRQKLTDSMAQKVRKDTELKIPLITIDDREYIMVSERDLKYVIKKKQDEKKCRCN